MNGKPNYVQNYASNMLDTSMTLPSKSAAATCAALSRHNDHREFSPWIIGIYGTALGPAIQMHLCWRSRSSVYMQPALMADCTDSTGALFLARAVT